MNKFELNYANTEYSDRHKKGDTMNKPKQTPIEWHSWDELVTFFKGYFEHFGDNISGIDEDTFKRMVKTIWRFSNVVAFREGMKYQKEITPNFTEMLDNWRRAVNEHNRNCKEEGDFHLTWDDLIGAQGYKYESWIA